MARRKINWENRGSDDEATISEGQWAGRTMTPHSLPDSYNLYQTTGTNIFVANVIVGKSDMRAFYFQQIDFCLIDYFFPNGQVPA